MVFPKTGSKAFTWLIKFINNKYIVVSLVFLIWMSFFDNKNMMVQFRLWHKIKELKIEKKDLENQYLVIRDEHNNITKDIERYAREKFYMHKENEEVFIIK